MSASLNQLETVFNNFTMADPRHYNRFQGHNEEDDAESSEDDTVPPTQAQYSQLAFKKACAFIKKHVAESDPGSRDKVMKVVQKTFAACSSHYSRPKDNAGLPPPSSPLLLKGWKPLFD